jgi:excisionase family DNA binding protein
MAIGVRKPTVPAPTAEAKVIEINAEMQGSMVFKDPVNLKINGTFNGTLETHGMLTVGSTAKVVANIAGDSIVLAGHVDGDIVARRMLTLMPTAVLKGTIKTPKLNIAEGAAFLGNCDMPLERPAGSDAAETMSLQEVAAYLEIDGNEIERLVHAGKVPGVRDGNGWRFNRHQIDQWASTGKVA